MKEERKKEKEREWETCAKIGEIASTIVFKCVHVLLFQSVWKSNIKDCISHLMSKIFFCDNCFDFFKFKCILLKFLT